MANLKVSDALMVTAEAVISIAKKSGIDLKLSDVYNQSTVKNLALVSAFLRQAAEAAHGSPIQVIQN